MKTLVLAIGAVAIFFISSTNVNAAGECENGYTWGNLSPAAKTGFVCYKKGTQVCPAGAVVNLVTGGIDECINYSSGYKGIVICKGAPEDKVLDGKAWAFKGLDPCWSYYNPKLVCPAGTTLMNIKVGYLVAFEPYMASDGMCVAKPSYARK